MTVDAVQEIRRSSWGGMSQTLIRHSVRVFDPRSTNSFESVSSKATVNSVRQIYATPLWGCRGIVPDVLPTRRSVGGLGEVVHTAACRSVVSVALPAAGSSADRWTPPPYDRNAMTNPFMRLMRVLPLNPIAVRLVQGGSTRSRHMVIRSGYLALMVLILLMALLGAGTTLRELAQRGAEAFAFVSTGQIMLICILAPVFLGGAIAQESNPQTWDVLLTSPLSSLQIVLGNLFGRLFFVFALLLSTFPLFAVTQLFGGVPGSAILESYAIAAASALLMGAIAITLSSTRAAGRRAVFIFYSAVILFLFATYAIDMALRTPVAIGSDAVFTTAMTPLNPFLTLRVLLESNIYLPRDASAMSRGSLVGMWLGSPIAAQLWFCTLLSIALIFYSTLRIRLLGGALIGGRKTLRSGAEREPRHVGTHPIAWREAHLRGHAPFAAALRWVFVAGAIALAIGVMLLARSSTLSPHDARLALAALLGAEVLVVTLAALNTSATAISREREDKSLDILLTTPIQPGPYLAGKLRGLVQYLVPLIAVPCATLAIGAIYSMTGGFGRADGGLVTESVGTGTVQVPLVLPETAIALPIVLTSFTALCVMIGLQWSVKSRGTIGSVFSATGVVLAIAGCIGLCGGSIGSSVPYGGAVINALGPMNLILMAVEPATMIATSLESPVGRRISILAGAVIAALIYCAVVYGLHASIKASFMMTVRRLSGTS